MVILQAGCREGENLRYSRKLASPREIGVPLSPRSHTLVRQPIGNLILFAHRVPDFEMLKPANQLLRLLIQLAQFGMTHLVDAFHLPDHQFGIADHLERFDLVFSGVTESGDESLILGIVVGVVSKIFAELGDRMPGGVTDGDTIAGRPWIAAGSAVDVGGVGGGHGFRSGEKIAEVGRTRRHGASLQRYPSRLGFRYSAKRAVMGIIAQPWGRGHFGTRWRSPEQDNRGTAPFKK